MIYLQNSKGITIKFDETDTLQQINTLSEKIYQLFKQNKDKQITCKCGFSRNASVQDCPVCKAKLKIQGMN
jgi:hypothetical protein